jgi:hypothetical protein
MIVGSLLLLCCVTGAYADSVVGNVILYQVEYSSFRSVGYATYYNALGQRGSAAMSGEHVVTEVDPGSMTFTAAVQGDGSYYYDFEGPTDPGACYGTSLHVIATPPTPPVGGQTQFEETWYGYTQQCDPRLRPVSSYNIEISTNVDGTIAVLRTERYQQGASLQYSPVTPPDYRFTGWSGVVNSSQQTVTFQMPGHDTGLCANFTYDGGGGGPGGDDSGIGNEALPCFPGIDANCHYSPIIINLEKGGYRLTGRNEPVLFDIAGNGHPRLMAWTASGADEAFLWLDRNDDGMVTSGAELFGNFTPLQNGQFAKNGFEALREFDANGDGIIDERDPMWSRLTLWRDLNHNGVSEQTEIQPIAGSGVVSIDLHDHWSGRHDTLGNLFKYESLVSIENGSGHGVRREPVYDILFVPLPFVP